MKIGGAGGADERGIQGYSDAKWVAQSRIARDGDLYQRFKKYYFSRRKTCLNNVTEYNYDSRPSNTKNTRNGFSPLPVNNNYPC